MLGLRPHCCCWLQCHLAQPLPEMICRSHYIRLMTSDCSACLANVNTVALLTATARTLLVGRTVLANGWLSQSTYSHCTLSVSLTVRLL
jgi:hypothetical protein